jgi:anti-sigma regulatory factor (Ser/Thr protein kinase)
MSEAPFRLTVAADPSMSVTIRVFVAEAGRRLGLSEPEVEDLRLLATELLGNAVAHGDERIEFRVDADQDGWVLEGHGVGTIWHDTDVDRREVLRGLATVRSDDGVIVLRPLPPD